MKKINEENIPNEVPIVILSHNRADRVHTYKAIDNCLVCVEESQVEEYAKYVPRDKIVSHPDAIKGLPPKRQWVFDKYGTVFVLDDDVTAIRIMNNHKARKLSSEEAYAYIQNLYTMAVDLDCYLFGIRIPVNHMAYDFYYYNFRGIYPAGGFCGVIDWNNNELYNYNDRKFLAEDMFLALLCIFKYRYFLTDTRVSIDMRNAGKGDGGVQEIRNYENEKYAYTVLRKHFGDSAQSVRREKNKNSTKNSQKHYFNRRLNTN